MKSGQNKPFFRRTRRSEKRDYYTGSCMMRVRKYRDYTLANQVKDNILAALSIDDDLGYVTRYIR
jgi:hypothetical protein